MTQFRSAVLSAALLLVVSCGDAPSPAPSPGATGVRDDALGPPTMSTDLGKIASAPLPAAGEGMRFEIEPLEILPHEQSPRRRIRYRWCLRGPDGKATTATTAIGTTDPSEAVTQDGMEASFRYGATWARWRLRIDDGPRISCWVIGGQGEPAGFGPR